ncbi:unnamed protein product [Linum tenue]|uniref:Anthranilate synthase n=1 Tax=Linum tenue TaxID=586396 RepID=A0AAV0IG24_9ROSI|nr:unnamed protein product [Linum tenue]
MSEVQKSNTQPTGRRKMQLNSVSTCELSQLRPSSLLHTRSFPAMGRTLAVALPQPPPPLRLPAAPSVNFDGRLTSASFTSSSSISLVGRSSRFGSHKCAASTYQPIVDQSEKFHEAAKKGNLIPLHQCLLCDHLTPVLAYRCLVREDDRDAPSFLFESVQPGLDASTVGRYSIIGAQPTIEIVAKENMVTTMYHHENRREEQIVDDPMDVPRRIMEGWTPQLVDELPECFCGGWVGFFSYDTVRFVEKKKMPFSAAPPDDRNLPDIHLGLYDDVIVFDHVDKKAHLIHWVQLDRYSSIEEAYNDGIDRLMNLISRIHDIAPGCILVASSPEILTRVKKNKITNRPLAGTVRRGKTPKEDLMLETELLNDEKQCAEHIMLVDLGRNDVGKVSKPGSVKVEKLMNIERYSHVMHISSTVTGEMLDNLTSWDVLRAALPVGTVSGAPKVKAMELIDELEVTRRGPYSGGFGGISFNGDMDIALALRTIVFPTSTRYDTMYSYADVNKRREWVAHIQAGAGIVADSDPDDEQRECENKAAGLARAIDLAESSFVNK